MIGRCRFMACESMLGTEIKVVDAERGASKTLLCPDHRTEIMKAAFEGYYLGVTPIEIRGQIATGGTVWINTIPDFWLGKRPRL